GEALITLRATARSDTSLALISAPPLPAEVQPLIRIGSGLGWKLAIFVYPIGTMGLPDRAAAEWEARATSARSPLQHAGWEVFLSLLGYLNFVGLVFFPDTFRFELPTIGMLKAMRSALATVGATADVQPAPALPLAPLMLASITGVWTAAFSSHALAARARSP